MLVKVFKTSQHLVKLQTRKLIVSRTLQWLSTVLLKVEELARYLE